MMEFTTAFIMTFALFLAALYDYTQRRLILMNYALAAFPGVLLLNHGDLLGPIIGLVLGVFIGITGLGMGMWPGGDAKMLIAVGFGFGWLYPMFLIGLMVMTIVLFAVCVGIITYRDGIADAWTWIRSGGSFAKVTGKTGMAGRFPYVVLMFASALALTIQIAVTK